MPRSSKKVRIFSALEVANICGVVNQTAINWIKNGYLKAFTTPGGQYRVYSEDLIGFLTSRNMKVPDELRDQSIRDHSQKILIVDDDRTLNNLLKQYYEKRLSGFEIHQAFDGFEAGRLLAEERPNLVVLDIGLPGINGHEICRRLRGDTRFGRPRVLAITGLHEAGLRETILAEGADAFIPKPLDLDEFIEVSLDLLKQPAEK